MEALRELLAHNLRALHNKLRGLDLGAESSQITLPRFHQAVTELGFRAHRAAINDLFAALDPHRCGTIDVIDLIRELRAHRPPRVGVRELVDHPSSASSLHHSRVAISSGHEAETKAFALINEGRLVEALSMLELAMTRHQRELGGTSPEMLRCTRAAADVCNSMAMQAPCPRGHAQRPCRTPH